MKTESELARAYDRLDEQTQKRVKAEDERDGLKKLVLALMLIVATGSAQAEEQPASPVVAAAVSALYVANDAAQAAVDEVMCGTMRRWRHMDGETLRQVRHVRAAVEAAVKAEGTAALVEFCDWAGER